MAEPGFRFLLADTDEDLFIDSHNAFVKSGGKPQVTTPQPVQAKSMRECQKFLSNRDFEYAAVFVSPNLGMPAWLAVIKSTHQFRPDSPVYVIYDEPPKLTPAEIKKLGVQGFVKKPIDYKKMLELIFKGPGPAAPEVEAAEPPPQPKLPPEPKDSDFLSVELKYRVGSIRSLFNLYVRLPTGKYLQILAAGDQLSQDRIDSYKKKGAEKLYILKTAQEEYLNFCDELVKKMLNDGSVSNEIKAEQVSGQGEDIQGFLKVSGFSEASMERAKQYVANVTEMIAQINPQTEALKTWMNDVAAREHAVGVTTVAGLMMKNIGVANPAVYNSMGIACFLHDIGLAGQDPVIQEEDPDKMSEEQKAIYLEHPIVSAKLISKMKSVPPAVVKAVEQHHLRLNKQGFPASKVVDTPNLIAELIGLSEEFVKLMKKALVDTKINPIAEIQKIAPGLFSPKIVDPFLRTISEK